MITELISVGTEILLGNIVNTNSTYLSEQCALLGLSVYYQTVVGDNHDRLKETIERAMSRSDIVILTGGLGPTKDDLTKETAAECMGLSLAEDAHTRRRIEEAVSFFVKNGRNRKITQNNYKQALVPEGAIVLDNNNGTAPGLILEKDQKTLILLPGPPEEMKQMFKESVFPYLRKKQPEIICSAMVKICGYGESQVAEEIQDLIDSQTNPTVAPYAKIGEVHLRITAKGTDEASCRMLIDPVILELKRRFGNSIFAVEENKTLEASVVEILKEQNLKLAVAESCTAGAFAARIVNVPGASDILTGGFITYSNEAKQKMLGVLRSTLDFDGAVSEKCAGEMARGAVRETGSDVGVSITGLAGPDGGTPETPVGTVFIGCCIGAETVVRKYCFKGNRQKIRNAAVVSALTLLRECAGKDLQIIN